MTSQSNQSAGAVNQGGEDLSKGEESAIRSLKRGFAAMPDTLRIYVLDDQVIVCKIGVSSKDLTITVGSVATPCDVLTEVHDDEGYGNE